MENNPTEQTGVTLGLCEMIETRAGSHEKALYSMHDSSSEVRVCKTEINLAGRQEVKNLKDKDKIKIFKSADTCEIQP